jgi:hypothetical protein
VFRFIATEKANHRVWLLCAMLGVSLSGFHAWQSRPPPERDPEDGSSSAGPHRSMRRAAAPTGRRGVHAELRRARRPRRPQAGRARPADCFDNAVLESLHPTIEKDLIHRRSCPTKAEARVALFE